jgi:hypothetical protein
MILNYYQQVKATLPSAEIFFREYLYPYDDRCLLLTVIKSQIFLFY